MGFMDGFLGRKPTPKANYKSNKVSYDDIFAGLDDSDDDALVDQAIYSESKAQQTFRQNVISNTKSDNGWYTCPICKKKFRAKDGEADHIGPKSKGGTNATSNGQFICKSCNRSKRADTSNTNKDLARRQEELRKQKQEDIAYLKAVQQVLDDEDKKKNKKSSDDSGSNSHHNSHYRSNHHSNNHHNGHNNHSRRRK